MSRYSKTVNFSILEAHMAYAALGHHADKLTELLASTLPEFSKRAVEDERAATESAMTKLAQAKAIGRDA